MLNVVPNAHSAFKGSGNKLQARLKLGAKNFILVPTWSLSIRAIFLCPPRHISRTPARKQSSRHCTLGCQQWLNTLCHEASPLTCLFFQWILLAIWELRGSFTNSKLNFTLWNKNMILKKRLTSRWGKISKMNNLSDRTAGVQEGNWPWAGEVFHHVFTWTLGHLLWGWQSNKDSLERTGDLQMMYVDQPDKAQA